MIDRRTVEEIVRLIGDDPRILHMPFWDDAPGGGDVDCVARNVDPLWPLRLPDGWRLLQHLKYDITASYWVIERDGEMLAIDILEDPKGRGRYGIRSDQVPSTDGLTASPAFRAAYLTAKRVGKGLRDEHRWGIIGQLAADEPKVYRGYVMEAFGPRLGADLATAGLEGRPPSPAVWKRARRIQGARRLGIAGGPSVLIQRISRLKRRVFAPTGLFVVLAGPDGTGKSTLAGAVLDGTEPAFRRRSHSHWRPGLLPRPGALAGRAESDSTRPHDRQPHGRILSFALLGWHFLDFLIGGWGRWMPFRARSGLVLNERGWMDIAVDPRRYGLQADPRLVAALGRFLPSPDLVLLLEATPETIVQRKDELTGPEVARQLEAWRKVAPNAVRLDAASSAPIVADRAIEAVSGSLARRALTRLDGGWVQLPGGNKGYLVPARAAGAATALHQPVTTRQRLLWRAAGSALGARALRALPRVRDLPERVIEVVGPLLPRGGNFSIARSTHPGRWMCLIADREGQPFSMVKVASDEEGAEALRREADAINTIAPGMPTTVQVPKVLDAGEGWLALEGLRWLPRKQLGTIPLEVADALGVLFSQGQGGRTGPTHGDFAPWNLLRTEGGWALVDWEAARADGDAFDDLFHYLVMSSALIGEPSAEDIIDGVVRGEGPHGAALRVYAHAAEIETREITELFRRFLFQWPALSGSTRDATAKGRARARLIALLGRT